MKLNHYISIVILLIVTLSQAQHQITIDATLLPKSRTITIKQELVYKNNSDSTLNEIYLNDWANSFSSKNTPLAKRFSENYQSSFHFEKNKNRGHSKIISIKNDTKNPLIWTRGDEVDIIRVQLDANLLPGETCILKMEYHIILPDDKFTKYGITKGGDFKIRYWYIAPAFFDGEWNIYSNKDLNDSYLNPTNFNIKFHTPYNFNLISDLDLVSEITENKIKTTELKGENRMQVKLQLLKNSDFKTIKTDKLLVSTNHTHLKITPPIQSFIFSDEKRTRKKTETIKVIKKEFPDIDVIGGLKVKEKLKDAAISIFIQPPSMAILEERLRKRQTDTEEKIQIRLAKAEEEMSHAHEFDHVIVNDDLTKAIAEVEQIVLQMITQ